MEVDKDDLIAIQQSTVDIINTTKNKFVGGTAIDILAILEKYIEPVLFEVVDK